MRNASSQLELRNAQDNSLLVVLESSEQAPPAEYLIQNGLRGSESPAQIARDGAWVWAATTAGLFAWRTSDGAQLWRRPGDYSNAQIVADVEGAYVAGGPAGEHLIEFIRAAGDESSVSPEFSGEFLSWFERDPKFFTREGSTYRIVNADGSVAQTLELDETVDLVGSGSTFAVKQSDPTRWDNEHGYVFPVGGTTPLIQANTDGWESFGMGTFTLALGRLYGTDVALYDLRTDPPTQRATVSADYGWVSISASTLTDDTEGNWAMTTTGSGSPIWIGSGSTVSQLGCGGVTSIAGSESGRFIVEVGGDGGQLWVVEQSPSGWKLLGGLHGRGAQLSADGATLLHLASRGADAEWVLHKLPTPSHPSLTRVVLPPDLLPRSRNIELAKNGTVAAVYGGGGYVSAEGVAISPDCTTRVVDLNTGEERFTLPDTCPTGIGQYPASFWGISPDGWDIAFNFGSGVLTSHAGEPLVPQGDWFLGWIGSDPIIGTAGWLDDDRPGGPEPALASARVAGRSLALSDRVPTAEMQAAGKGLFYDPTSRTVRSNSDGSIVFQSTSDEYDTVVAGNRLVHWNFGQISSETFR
ncbi:MAG: hypothetical protein QM778_34185 [Myxococcales bacterium]